MTQRTPEERRGTAYHEAGHAVVHLYLGLPVTAVTIAPNADEDSLGHMEHPSPLGLDIPATRTAQRQAAPSMMVGCYAGLEAQRLVDADPAPFHGENDADNAASLAREFGVRTDPERLRKEARRLVRRLRPFVDRLYQPAAPP